MTTTNQHIRISSVELEPSDADKESLELSSYYGTDHKIVSFSIFIMSDYAQLTPDCHTA